MKLFSSIQSSKRIAIALCFLFLVGSCEKKDSNQKDSLQKENSVHPNILAASKGTSREIDIVKNEIITNENFKNIEIEIIQNQTNYSFNPRDYNFSSYRAVTYKTSPVRILFVYSKSNSDDFLNLFEYKGKFIVTRSIIRKDGENKRLFFYTEKNNLIYSVLFNDKGQFGNFQLGNVNFSVRSLLNNNEISANLEEVPPADGGQTCPQQFPGNFGSCMTCAINECANSFPCNVTCTLLPHSCLIGFALGCAL